MKKIVERLRERPEDERKTVAAGIALATVGILFVGWGFSFVQGLGNGSSVVAQQQGTEAEANTASVQTSQQASAQAATSTNASDSLYYSITQ